MIVPSTYHYTPKNKYLVLVEVKHVWRNGKPDETRPLSMRVYDVLDGHFEWIDIDLFQAMEKEGKLKFVTKRKWNYMTIAQTAE